VIPDPVALRHASGAGTVALLLLSGRDGAENLRRNPAVILSLGILPHFGGRLRWDESERSVELFA
jgi:hypothetical protein